MTSFFFRKVQYFFEYSERVRKKISLSQLVRFCRRVAYNTWVGEAAISLNFLRGTSCPHCTFSGVTAAAAPSRWSL